MIKGIFANNLKNKTRPIPFVRIPRQHSAFYFGTKDVSTKPLKTPGERRLILDCLLVFPFYNTTCLKHVFKMVNSLFLEHRVFFT
jgi:hypothetical protein